MLYNAIATVIFSLMSIIGPAAPSKVLFLKTPQEELDQVVCYFVENTGATAQDVTNDVLSASQLQTNRQNLYFLPEIVDHFIAKGLADLHDMQKTFDALKIMMKIPDDVKIMFSFNHVLMPSGVKMSYNPLDRTLYVYPRAMEQSCRSSILFALIHELTHAQQHMRMGLLGWRLASIVEKEHEADLQAIDAIKCPICIQAIEANELLSEATVSVDQITQLKKDGYLVGADYPFYKALKSNDDLCAFHKQGIGCNQSLKSAGLSEIVDFDFNNGSLYDRLSTMKFC